MTKAKEKKAKYLEAKPDVEAAIRKHGLDAVRYIVSRKHEAQRLKNRLAQKKRELQREIDEVESKLARS